MKIITLTLESALMEGVAGLGISYEDFLVELNKGLSDDELLQWAYATGRVPNDEEVFIWNLSWKKEGGAMTIQRCYKRTKKASASEIVMRFKRSLTFMSSMKDVGNKAV